MIQQPKPFTGRAALLWIVLFFGVVSIANGIMIWFALNTAGAVQAVS